MAKEGRPLKFDSVVTLQKAIDEYFISCHGDDGKLIRPISITGLALALDTCRQTLLNYEEKAEFLDTIRKAKLRVENFYEERLTSQSVTGSIFALKNFDWKDKVEQDTTLKGDKEQPVQVNHTGLIGDQISRILGTPEDTK